MTPSPMWIVWFIVIAVAAIVIGALIKQHEPGESLRDTIGASPLTLLGSCVFGSGCLLGFLVTGLSSPTLVDWWQALAVRVAWQLGGAVLLAIAIVREAGSVREAVADWRIAVMTAAFLAIGAALSFGAARDLIGGPVVLRGRVSVEVEKVRGGRGAGSIFANVSLEAPDGSTEHMDLSGWRATEGVDKLAKCEDGGGEIDVTALMHVEAVVDVACR